jgi:hypothetical protein
MSRTSQKNATIEKMKMSIAEGFMNSESLIWPFNNNSMARVPPQPGHGTPVTFLKIQTSTFVLDGKNNK